MPVGWSIRIANPAKREMKALPGKVIARVDLAIIKLEDNPHPPSSRKLRGHLGYRLRVGRYRVLYDIDKNSRTITIYAVRHRREAYRER